MSRNYKSGVGLGIDVGATYIKYGLVTNSGKLLKLYQLPTPKNRRQFIKTLIKIIKTFQPDITKVGIGLPGRINKQAGKIIHYRDLPIANLAIVKLIKRQVNLPIKIDNDARCFALAESLIGSAKNYQVVVGITIGTGVGGGLVINKKLFYGQGHAGEIGHQFIDFKRAKDWEDYLGAGKLKLTSTDYQKLERLAKQKDKKALRFWEQLGTIIGFGCLNIIHVLNPDIIILGGKQARAFKLFYPAMIKIIKKYCLIQPPKIVKSQLIDRAGIIGAALLFEIRK